jgi:hypothetical protein
MKTNKRRFDAVPVIFCCFYLPFGSEIQYIRALAAPEYIALSTGSNADYPEITPL